MSDNNFSLGEGPELPSVVLLMTLLVVVVGASFYTLVVNQGSVDSTGSLSGTVLSATDSVNESAQLVEVETGSLSGAVSVGNDDNASGGQYIQFGK